MSLLISTVLSGSRNRLAPLAGAAVDDAGDRGAVLRADDEHVAAVAVGDDLLLQVLRRVLAAQVGLERSAQPRALLAQAVADAPQLGARVVDDLAATGSILRRTSAISRSNDAAGFDDRAEPRERRRGAADAGGGRVDGCQERREPEEVQRLERAPFDGERFEDRVELRGRAQRDLAGAREEPRRFGRRRERGRDRARVGQRCRRARPVRARRRLRQPADGRDDAIEFEGL